MLLCIFESFKNDTMASLAREYSGGDCYVFTRCRFKFGHLWVGLESRADFIGWICPFYPSVETFGVLTKDNHIDVGLNDIPVYPSHIVERISFKTLARTDTEVQVEMLTEPDDRTVVNIPLILELRAEFFCGFVFGFGSDGSKKANPVLL